MSSFLLQMGTTIGGGLAFITLALIFKRLKPQWHGFRALLMLAGGVIAIIPIAKVIGLVTGWLQDLFRLFAMWASGIPTAGTVFQDIFTAIAAGMPWIIAVGFAGWVIHDMFPRLTALRSSGGGTFGDRLGNMNAAAPRTMWIALVVPASLALLAPLSFLQQLGASPQAGG
jgi:hypothetical protein